MRLNLWLLADLVEWVGGRLPSELLRLPEAGWSEAACLDFDLSVRGLKRWADEREKRTKLVDAGKPDPRPKKAVPVFRTLAEVLALPAEDAREAARLSGLTDEVLEDLGGGLLDAMSNDDDDDDGDGEEDDL